MNTQELKELFKAIEREDIKESDTELLSSGKIDSLDIMALVAAIEKHFHQALKAEFIKAENFESFESIQIMIKEAFGK